MEYELLNNSEAYLTVETSRLVLHKAREQVSELYGVEVSILSPSYSIFNPRILVLSYNFIILDVYLLCSN